MNIKIIPNDKGNPPGKLADAELHFTSGPLEGLKLIGFGVWGRRGGGRNVTFPARAYVVNGERRSFALLRPAIDNGEVRSASRPSSSKRMRSRRQKHNSTLRQWMMPLRPGAVLGFVFGLLLK